MEDVGLALENGGDALQPHAGVHRLHGQLLQRAVFGPVVLHEDEIPELEEAVGFAAHHIVAKEVLALVDVQLGAGTAGAGRTHGPEIFLVAGLDVAETDDAALGQTRHLAPDRRRFVVVLVDRGIEPGGIDTVILRHQLPSVDDGLFLVIVAERPVAQHLEPGVVAAVLADGVEIVVLAAHPHARLAIGGPGVGTGLAAKEGVLELVHAGVGEEQRRIVGRDDVAGSDDGVAALLEEVEKAAADVRGFHGRHGSEIGARAGSRRQARAPATAGTPAGAGR